MSTEAIIVSKNAIKDWEVYNKTYARDEFFNEKATHRDIGGFYSGQFSVETEDREEAVRLVTLSPGRHVEFRSEKGILDWEGMIRSAEFNTGIHHVRCDLRNMANKVFTRYQPVGGGATVRSSTVEYAASQDRWGSKTWVLSGGEMSAPVADQRAQVYLNDVYWASPQIYSIQQAGVLKDVLEIKFTLIGYWQVLDWAVYNQVAVAGEIAASDVVGEIIADPDVAQYISTSELETNGTLITKKYDADRRPTGILKGICGVGDSQFNPWISGFGPNRSFYYRQAALSRLPT
jgi:hypothetical protein